MIVHSMNRLARNLDDLRRLVQNLTKRGIRIEFVKEHLSFTGEDSPMANLMLSIMGAFSEFERALLRERQREDIALAKKRGAYKGRKKGSSGNWILLDLRLEKNGHGPHDSEASINTSGGKPCPRAYSTTHGESLAMTICEPNTSAARPFFTSTTNPANSDVPSAALKTSSSGGPNPATFEEFRSNTRKCGLHWTFNGLNARTVRTWDKFVWALRIHKFPTPGALNGMTWSCSR